MDRFIFVNDIRRIISHLPKKDKFSFTSTCEELLQYRQFFRRRYLYNYNKLYRYGGKYSLEILNNIFDINYVCLDVLLKSPKLAKKIIFNRTTYFYDTLKKKYIGKKIFPFISSYINCIKATVSNIPNLKMFNNLRDLTIMDNKGTLEHKKNAKTKELFNLCYQKTFENIPTTVKTIKIASSYFYGDLPSFEGLVRLSIYSKAFNGSLDNLPSTLTTLILECRNFTGTLNKLPRSLKTFVAVLDEYNNTFDNLPNSLDIFIYCGSNFKKTINKLPLTLNHFYFFHELYPRVHQLKEFIKKYKWNSAIHTCIGRKKYFMTILMNIKLDYFMNMCYKYAIYKVISYI